MAFHLSSFSVRSGASGNMLLKGLGCILSLISIVLAILGILTQVLQGKNFQGLDYLVLCFSLLVGLFGLRVGLLWLGAILHPPKTEQVATQQPPMNSRTMVAGSSTFPAPYTSAPLPLSAPPPYASIRAYAPTNALSLTPVPQAAYPLQPAYDMQTQLPVQQEINNQLRPEALPPYVPIEEDILFKFDEPVPNVQCFILPKEGEPLVECQDRYALNPQRQCYAVADGVAGSFVAGPWARIISKSFVERGGEFSSADEFKQWLITCTNAWYKWMQERWVPTMNALRLRNGDNPGDWSNDIRQGAQTTLIGCTLTSGIRARNAIVSAIGDGEFFLFRPSPRKGWELAETFPYNNSNEFGSRPDTLATMSRPDLLDRAWAQRKTKMVRLWPGDCIVLASDTLAKWLLMQVEQGSERWIPFLTNTDPHLFERYIREELHAGRIEDDDLTMLIIHIH